jgi:DNA polymerase-1
MEIKVKLTLDDDGSTRQRVQEAQAKKQADTETLEDAWRRILGMKNSTPDQERLLYTAQAFKEGRAGREPEAKGKFSKAEALRIWRWLQDKERDQKLKDMVAKTPANYVLINTDELLQKLVADLYNEPIIALDTETTGLEYFGDDKTVGMSITLPKADYHVYIPYGHTTADVQLMENAVIEALKPRLESGHLKKVLHNAKFDIHMLWQHGIELRGLVWDTMVAMHLLNENEPSFALKVLATKYLKEPADTYKDLFGKTMFYEVPLDVALVYAGKDTDLTWRLYQFQLQHLAKMPNILKYYHEVENEILLVSVEMERTGFVLDTIKAQELHKQLSEELASLDVQLRQELGDINFNSPKQLGEKLFDELRLYKHFPASWKRSTDVSTLKVLAKHNEGCRLLLEYREKTKLLGTYIEALPKQIKKDGRIHGSLNQIGTVTGRYSSNNPNLQNQPKYARKLFIAPEGMVIIGGDFSQQEPRLLAHFSGEEALIQAYNNGEDLYSTMASKVFNVPIAECGDGSNYRKMMKFGVLSVMYGTGSKTLAGQLKITEAEAENFIEDFYKTFPKVTAWIEGNKEYARKYGFVWMIEEQRKRRLEGVKSKDKWERFRAERQATNAIIQGSASVQTKRTMIALARWCKAKRAEGRKFQILATVHDEVLIYAPKDVTRVEVYEFRDIMVNTMKLKVPNKSDIEIMKRWGEGYTVDEWFANVA